MASGSASSLAIKAAAVAAVLAVLVMPSLGRCPSLGPEPLPAVPAPATSCSDCNSRCNPMCEDHVAKECSTYCTPPASVDCDGCANGSVQGEQCRPCYDLVRQQCPYCRRSSYVQCTEDCYSQCHVTGVCA